MRRPIAVLPLILTGLIPLGAPGFVAPALGAQELGAFYSFGSSDQVEIPDPTGFGAFAQWEFPGSWLVRVSLHRFAQDTYKEGVVCANYSVRIDCISEMVDTSVTMGGLRGALMRAFHVGKVARIGAGLGVSFNQINAEATGETGRRADLLAPNTGQLGFLALLSGALAPLPSIPVRLTGTVTGHWVNFRSCSSNEPPQYAPFCGTDLFKDVELGVSYTFPR
jgi:hypothetical protein